MRQPARTVLPLEDALRGHRHRTSRAIDIFEEIAVPHVNLVVWQRALPPQIARTLARWVAPADLTVDLTVTTHSPDLASVVAPVRVPRLRQFLLDDLRRLFAAFVRLTDAPRVRVVLCTKRTDACRRLHTDYVRLRLITTYVGPGTEWPLDEAVDRAAMAQPCDCPYEANHHIVRDAAAIQQSRAGDVLLLKGERWAGEAEGAVHRSPPIEGTGQARLVLSLTTVEADA